MTDKNFGRDDLMAHFAFRYCLGRMTYAVGIGADWLIQQWPNICERTQNLIRKELDEAFQRDDEQRASGSEYLALGHDCDRAEWERVRKFIEDK